MPGVSNADKVVHQDITNNMRRANKTPAAVKRSHLDVQSGADISTKIHKKKSASNSSLALALLCGAAALCTLLYVSNRVFSSTPIKSERKVFSKHMEEIKKNNKYVPQENRLLPPDSIYRTKIEDIHGNYQQLMDYAGSVSLVVNVACE